jgi:hypothetical protein
MPGRPAEQTFRRALVERIKGEILEGRYETPRRLDGAIEMLLRRLRAGTV